MVLQPARLSPVAIAELTSPGNALYLSSVSAWEIGLLHGLGRIVLQQPASIFVPVQRQQHGIVPLPLGEDEALYVPNLPQLHRDPFDRMLICQAVLRNFTLLTPDPLIRQYPVQTDW